MHAKSTLALAAMAMAGGSFAFNHHRHLDIHAHMHKNRDLEARGLHTKLEWVTVYETVTVYKNKNGEIKTAGPDTYFVNEKPEEPAASPEVESLAETPKVAVAATPAAPAPAETNPAADDKSDGSVASAPAAPVGGKRGFAYNDCGLVNNFATGGGKGVSWAYNWDSNHNGLSAPVNYVPMLWGDIPEHTNRWSSNADKMIAQGSTHLLSFNEPDHPQQADRKSVV